ncbi:metal transporter [Sulfurifustis variabilis]|uniref:Metal transporter n=1 Tax=Sulfurifustis variabilis TaxID=1675686 RepID=A0A1B4V5T6_9GAMM|nr:efflux RND transporter periplasmic adaptor subunit [Sulfurifustis variabilis]BAU48795.1 metal transporter [Sulfurifustis variabilis]
MPVRAAFLLGSLLALFACTSKEPPKPPERVVTVTTAPVGQRDLAVTEAAVGAETAIVAALGYDPTRERTGTTYIRLPFPETIALQLKVGQPVRLSNFATPDQVVTGRIREIRPALNITTVSREVIVAVPRGEKWRPRGSVRGEVTLGVRKNAVTVPEQAVVLRPAGTVVYVVEGEQAKERRVSTGIAREGIIEIIEGLKPGETVVVDGAALLSNDTKIRIREGQS